MTLKQFKKLTPEQLKEYGKSIPTGKTYDKKGDILSYKDSYGYWEERTYKDGNLLTLKNSYGYWAEYARDKDGNELTHEYGIKGDESGGKTNE